MTKLRTTLAALAALPALFAGCAEAESPKPSLPLESPTASNVFSPQSSDEPLPADQVFIPDAHVENGALLFRIQLPPGYYLYKDKIGVRSLSEAIDLEDHEFIEEWSHSEIVVDEQGCKENGICYMPQAKVLSVDVPARLESAADKTE
jgi:thiol:disulfide interchange protein